MPTDPANLPPGIGPHEGIEFDLMRAGQKHVALFMEIQPEGWQDMLVEGFEALHFCQGICNGSAVNSMILYRRGYHDAALRLKDLIQNSGPFDPICEHEIGAVLGYSHDQVEAFIAHFTR